MARRLKKPDYGDRLTSDPRWVMESTGGGFSAWFRPVTDGASPSTQSPYVAWMITYDEGFAPPEGYAGRKESVALSLEYDGSTIAQAWVRSLAEAVALANIFRSEG